MWLVALPIAAVIGILLGALGGGGSILTVPALVYLLGQGSHAATTGSLVIVGLTAVPALIPHARAGHVRFRQGLTFAAIGVGGTWLGSRLSAHVPEDVLLGGFALVMVVAAVTMLRRLCDAPHAVGVASSDDGRGGTTVAVRHRVDARRAAMVLATATGVGLITGFFGVGGGFVIVPALVLVLGFEMPMAVGTSLLVIAVNSAVALLSRTGQSVQLDWSLLLWFTAVAIAGSYVGGRIASRLPADALTRAFAWLLIVVAAYMAIRSGAGIIG